MQRLQKIRATKVMQVFYKIENTLTILTLTAIISLTFYNVILRFVFRRGALWIDELISFLLVLMAMLGMAIGVKERSHTALENFVCKFSRRVQKVIYIFDSIIVAIFLFVASYGGFRFLGVVEGQSMVILGWPVSIMYGFVVIGCVLALIEHIIGTVEAIANKECRFIPLEEQMEMETEFNQGV